MAGDTQADVCIIGAGIAGLTTAYLLVREGRSVVVIDDGPPGQGETLRTTAHLTAAIDDRIFVLERRFGVRKTRLAVESQVAAIDRIERVCDDERLDGVFRRVDGHLFLHPDDDRSTLEQELAAAHRAGLTGVRLQESTPLPFEAGPCLVFPWQAEVDAGQYVAGLSDAITRMGGRIHASTHATELEEEDTLTVVTTKGRVECEAVVVCTNAPVFGKVPMHTKQDQYRTYVVAYEVPKGSVPRGLYWDTWSKDSGYHYIRLADVPDPDKELLIVGGEDHRTGEGDPAACSARLEEWCKTRFGLEGSPAYRWSGQVIEPADRLPFIGRYPGKEKNVYVITGDSGQGFTNHTCGAMLVTDLIQGRRNPWQGLYSPSRQGLTGLLRRLQAVGAGATELAKGKAGAGEVEDERDIKPGSGAVLTRDGVKLACYREPSGELRECAAECTHMGAIVRWNDLEKTWDCPWHGSRFKATGQVVNGPANKPLDPPERKETLHRKTSGRQAGRPHGRPIHEPHGGRPLPRPGIRAPATGRVLRLPDAIALLKEDHRRVKGLLKDLEKADDGATRRALFEEVERELVVHSRLEEELFYPRFKEAVGDDGEETRRYFEAHEEHEIAERVAAELREHRDPDAPAYAAKCKVLIDLIGHHIDEEEREMFPTARKAIGREDLAHLGDDMRQRKQEMLAGTLASLRRIAAPSDGIEPEPLHGRHGRAERHARKGRREEPHSREE